MKKLSIAFLTLLASFQIALALPVMAQTTPENDPLKNLQNTGIGTGNAADAGNALPAVIGRIIRVFMGVLGIIMVLLIIYAGFLWMTAGGNEENVEKAQALIKNSIIGLILILLAYAITGFVITRIQSATSG